jgi:hypothetical protein
MGVVFVDGRLYTAGRFGEAGWQYEYGIVKGKA